MNWQVEIEVTMFDIAEWDRILRVCFDSKHSKHILKIEGQRLTDSRHAQGHF